MKNKSHQPKQITPQSQNFSAWYADVVKKAELADYAPVKGCMIIKPYGYAIWERIQKNLNKLIKKSGVKNAYFPLFIPQSFLEKEKEHVAGFSPETAIVTIAGGKKLKEPLIVRPTSETIMYHTFASWVSSWRDLPLKINQWANVVRWEKRTYPFLRTTEFLWQEGHTAHTTSKEAEQEAQRALFMYRDFYQKFLAIQPVIGIKSDKEKFAGAQKTYTVEIMTKNGRAIQGATSHNLGQNFAKAFEITFQDKDKKLKYVWQTSWGLSTRAIGALIMAHGDDKGLVIPPKIAPIQAIIIPIFGKKKQEIKRYAQKVALSLEILRVEIDQRENLTPGWKFNDWEVKGVPVRIEIGPKELKQQSATISRRDKPGKKETVKLEGLKERVGKLLDEIQESIYQRHKALLKQKTVEVETLEEFKKQINLKKFILAFWCEDPECEKKIQEESKATNRCLPLKSKKQKGRCLVCSKPAFHRWLFAKAY